MKPIHTRHVRAPYLLAGILLLVIAALTPGCKNKISFNQPNVLPPTHFNETDSMVIVFNPNNSHALLNQFIDSILLLYPGGIHPHWLCPSCDSTLILLDGPSIDTWLQTGTADGGNGGGAGRPGGVGDDIPGSITFCRNFNTSIPELYEEGHHPDSPYVHHPFVTVQHTSDTTVVGVLDSGIDTLVADRGLARYIVADNGIPSCMGRRADRGWNFVNPLNGPFDDYHGKHGTVVSRFIVEQAEHYNGSFVRILPVKVFGSVGHNNLFDILCAISYAAQQNVQIINASFGYYAKRTNRDPDGIDSAGLLFAAYVDKYLTPKNILLIAAAGNAGNPDEILYFQARPDDPANAPRNLDRVSFYPASLSRKMPGVITVTTTSPDNFGRVSPNQNFSPQVVDIGVRGDTKRPENQHFVFENPVIVGDSSDGTSFATPIVTGKIAAYYHQMNLQAPFTREAITAALRDHNLLDSLPPLPATEPPMVRENKSTHRIRTP